jgi:hypothetical protein
VRRRKRKLIVLDRAALAARESFQRPGFAQPRGMKPEHRIGA